MAKLQRCLVLAVVLAVISPIYPPRFGKGSLITPQGSKQTTLTDVQIRSKQPSRGGKQMTKAGRGEATERLGLPVAILK